MLVNHNLITKDTERIETASSYTNYLKGDNIHEKFTKLLHPHRDKIW